MNTIHFNYKSALGFSKPASNMLNDFYDFHVDRLDIVKVDLILLIKLLIISNLDFAFEDINWSLFLKKPI